LLPYTESWPGLESFLHIHSIYISYFYPSLSVYLHVFKHPSTIFLRDFLVSCASRVLHSGFPNYTDFLSSPYTISIFHDLITHVFLSCFLLN
jgi:hypothetical protein